MREGGAKKPDADAEGKGIESPGNKVSYEEQIGKWHA